MFRNLVAFKDPSSYLRVSGGKYKLIENSAQLHSSNILKFSHSIEYALYINHLHFYLLYFAEKFYRKDIDERDPYIYMELDCRCRPQFGLGFRYTKLNKRLIIPKMGKGLAVVNLERKHVEIEIRDERVRTLEHLKIFGDKENQIICLDISGTIFLYSVCFQLKKVCSKQSYQINSNWASNKFCSSLNISHNRRFILVGLKKNRSYQSRVVLLFELKRLSLRKLATLSEENQGIGYKTALEFLGTAGGDHLLWVGLSADDGFAQIYDYNTESRELRELDEKRVRHQESFPKIIHRLENKFYFSGKKDKIMELLVTL